MRRRLGPRVLVLVAALAAAGCGAPPPQAPTAQANRVASALSAIAAACGEHEQQRAFGRPEDASVLEASASMRARELAGVYREGREWIYNGDTLRQIVALSIRQLRGCGLSGAAATLRRLTGVSPS